MRKKRKSDWKPEKKNARNSGANTKNPGKLAGIPPKVLAKGLPRKTRKG